MGGEMTAVRAERCAKKPDLSITAAELLKRCREFYQDPENEEAYLSWKAGQERNESAGGRG